MNITEYERSLKSPEPVILDGEDIAPELVGAVFHVRRAHPLELQAMLHDSGGGGAPTGEQLSEFLLRLTMRVVTVFDGAHPDGTALNRSQWSRLFEAHPRLFVRLVELLTPQVSMSGLDDDPGNGSPVSTAVSDSPA